LSVQHLLLYEHLEQKIRPERKSDDKQTTE